MKSATFASRGFAMVLASPLILFALLSAVALAVAALTILKPYIIWMCPNDVAGPDGFYFDTRNHEGVFDIFPAQGRK